MKKIDIIIPTRHRLSKLTRCINSIAASRIDQPKLAVIIIVDGDKLTNYEPLLFNSNGLISRITHVLEHKGSVYCRNIATQSCEDALIYATDDISFEPGSIQAAVEKMKSTFPDDDGVIGFNQINANSYSIAGVGLVGQTFLRRYPDRKLFFPGYFHFSCQEIERLGLKLGKIALAEDARILHYHPLHDKKEKDRTHTEARKYRLRDKTTSLERARNGLLWGDYA